MKKGINNHQELCLEKQSVEVLCSQHICSILKPKLNNLLRGEMAYKTLYAHKMSNTIKEIFYSLRICSQYGGRVPEILNLVFLELPKECLYLKTELLTRLPDTFDNNLTQN